MYLEIDTTSQVPIYAQIMDRIRALVRTDGLRPGAPLPSVRQLAADLEINPNTVAKAYALLERDGLIQTARRRGTSIAPSAKEAARETLDSRLDEAIDRVIEAANSLGIDHEELVTALERRGRRGKRRRVKRSSK